jgi:hypothetical protein
MGFGEVMQYDADGNPIKSAVAAPAPTSYDVDGNPIRAENAVLTSKAQLTTPEESLRLGDITQDEYNQIKSSQSGSGYENADHAATASTVPDVLQSFLKYPISTAMAAANKVGDLVTGEENGSISDDAQTNANNLVRAAQTANTAVRDYATGPVSAGVATALKQIIRGAGVGTRTYNPLASEQDTSGTDASNAPSVAQDYEESYANRNKGLQSLVNDPVTLAALLAPGIGELRAAKIGRDISTGLDLAVGAKDAAELATPALKEQAIQAIRNAIGATAGARIPAAVARDAAESVASKVYDAPRIAQAVAASTPDAAVPVLRSLSAHPGLEKVITEHLPSVVAGGLEGLVLGNTYSMLNDKEQSPIADALTGGTAGLVGSVLERRALDNFPGLGIARNRNISPSTKALVRRNLEDILDAGVLPKGKRGYETYTKDLQSQLGKKYDAAARTQEGSKASVIDPQQAKEDAALIGGLLAGKIKQTKNPQELVDLAGRYMTNVENALVPAVRKLPQATALSGAHKAAFRKSANAGIDALGIKDPALVDELKGIVNDHLTNSRTRSELETSLYRALQDYGAEPYRSTGLPQLRADADALLLRSAPTAITAEAGATRESMRPEYADRMQRIEDDIRGNVLRSKEGEAAISHDVLSRMRNHITNPFTYGDPLGTAGVLSKETSRAWHDAINDVFSQNPEYVAALGKETPRKFALARSLEDVLAHPGNLGLQDRMMFGLPHVPFVLNDAVDHWVRPSLYYKAGKAIQRTAPVLQQKTKSRAGLTQDTISSALLRKKGK